MTVSAVGDALPTTSVVSAAAGRTIAIDPSAMTRAARPRPNAFLPMAPRPCGALAPVVSIYTAFAFEMQGRQQRPPMFVTGPRIFSNYDGMTIPYQEAIERAQTIVPVAR